MGLKYRNIYAVTKRLFLYPDLAWPEMIKSTDTFKSFLRNYLFAVAMVSGGVVFLIHLLQNHYLQAIGLAMLSFISCICSSWLAFWLTREYMCRKLCYSEREVLALVGYSHAIFFIFYSIGQAWNGMFIGQIFMLLSFSFFRTLYQGIKQLENYQPQHLSNVLIVFALAIIFMPMIMNQILRIIFGVSVIHV